MPPDATILIPTHDHPDLIPFSVESALAQTGVSVEVLVVGDGVTDRTREALEPFGDSIRFFDFPKGERNGELHRHRVLEDAQGRVVCYLGDDDLLLGGHCQEMISLLADADFAHSYPVFVREDGSLSPGLVDLSRPGFQQRMLEGECQVSLTGAAHTMDAYRRLPFGWRPAPADVWSDLYMWQQFLRQPGFRGVTSWRCTHLKLSANARAEMTASERVAEISGWWDRAREPGFEERLAKWVKPYRRVATRHGASSRTGSRRSPG